MDWKVYLVRCADDTLYCGMSKDIASRIRKHNAGKGAKYTKSRRPVTLMAVSSGMSRPDALKLERSIKRKPAGEKIAALGPASVLSGDT